MGSSWKRRARPSKASHVPGHGIDVVEKANAKAFESLLHQPQFEAPHDITSEILDLCRPACVNPPEVVLRT